MNGIGKVIFKGDIYIWLIIAVLMFSSAIFSWSSSGYLAFDVAAKGADFRIPMYGHIRMIIISFVAILLVERIPFTLIRRFTPRLLLPFSCLLLLILIVWGTSRHGASRSLYFLGFNFQPIEVCKTLLTLATSHLLALYTNKEMSNKVFYSFCAAYFFFAILIGINNGSSAILIGGVVYIMMYMSGLSYKRLLTLAALVLLLVGTAYGIAKLMGDKAPGRLYTQVTRIETFAKSIVSDTDTKITDEEKDKRLQSENAKLAVARGKHPCGLGNSKQRDYLPNAFDDCIYAIMVEETGVVAIILYPILYLLLLFRIGVIVSKCQHSYEAITAIGLGTLICLQAFTNMAVSTDFIPNTGQPLPLISHGGTSLIITGINLGIILNISESLNSENPQAKSNKTEQQKQTLIDETA